MLGAFFVNCASLFMLSAILEKQKQKQNNGKEITTVSMPPALIEGAETVIAFSVMIIFSQYKKSRKRPPREPKALGRPAGGPLADGEHTYTAVATEVSPLGNPEGKSEAVTFIVNTNPPLVTLNASSVEKNRRTGIRRSAARPAPTPKSWCASMKVRRRKAPKSPGPPRPAPKVRGRRGASTLSSAKASTSTRRSRHRCPRSGTGKARAGR